MASSPADINVHGHEILQMVHTASTPLTRAALIERAHREFGAQARYCTCSASGLTLEELLSFLLSRGKIVEHEGRISTDPSRICSHGDHHEH